MIYKNIIKNVFVLSSMMFCGANSFSLGENQSSAEISKSTDTYNNAISISYDLLDQIKEEIDINEILDTLECYRKDPEKYEVPGTVARYIRHNLTLEKTDINYLFVLLLDHPDSLELLWWRSSDRQLRLCILLLFYGSRDDLEVSFFPRFVNHCGRFSQAESKQRFEELICVMKSKHLTDVILYDYVAKVYSLLKNNSLLREQESNSAPHSEIDN